MTAPPAPSRSSVRRLLGLALALGVALPLQPAFATTAAAGAADAVERSELAWLQAIQEAAQRVSYAGTIVYHGAGTFYASRIVHYFDGNVSHERLQVLDGRRREYIRRDDEVQCLYPDRRLLRLERRAAQDQFPALGGGTPAEILAWYRLMVRGMERVAGIDCRVLILEPKDSLRYPQWLCVDTQSALLLKARTLSEHWRPLEQMAFVDLRIGGRPDPAALRPSWSTEGWTVERVEPAPVDLAASGWQITPPAGFRLQRAVMRSLARDRSGRPTLHAVYSDGVATLSVFIDAGADSTMHEQLRRQGATSGFVRRLGDATVTVIGEVPPATVHQVALSVTRAPAR